MDSLSKLIHKQRLLCYCLILCIGLGGLFLSGCDPVAGHYPWEIAPKWVCNAPEMTFESTQLRDNTWSFSGELIWEDIAVDVDVAYRANRFVIYPENTSSHDDRLLSGTWRYDKDDLIFTIEEDFIFDGAYSTLVLHQE